jgi:hypothetical protein
VSIILVHFIFILFHFIICLQVEINVWTNELLQFNELLQVHGGATRKRPVQHWATDSAQLQTGRRSSATVHGSTASVTTGDATAYEFDRATTRQDGLRCMVSGSILRRRTRILPPRRLTKTMTSHLLVLQILL